MKARGEEDAIPDINGSVGKGGNEQLIPAWAGGSKGQEPEIRVWDPQPIGRGRRGGGVNELRSWTMR